jgi:hypothetical protein
MKRKLLFEVKLQKGGISDLYYVRAMDCREAMAVAEKYRDNLAFSKEWKVSAVRQLGTLIN